MSDVAAEFEKADDSRRERWETRSEIPLTVVAILFLAAYAWPILDPDVRESTAGVACRVITLTAWIAFLSDYLVRIGLSRGRLHFVRRHVLDLIVVVVPILRPLRLLRLITVLEVLNRRAETSLRGRVVIYGSGSTCLLTFVAALAVLDAERNADGSNIRSFGDALWWSLSTVTTAGYGDEYPVTTTGRLVAGGLRVASIAVLALVTASTASWLLEHLTESEEQNQALTQRDIAELAEQVRSLRAELLQPGARPRPGTDGQ